MRVSIMELCSKAFNTVDHAILLLKLKLKEQVMILLCDYLSDRQQGVLFYGKLSDWGSVLIDVPQGSQGFRSFAIYIYQ